MNNVKFNVTFTNVPNSLIKVFEIQEIDATKEIFVEFNRAENLDLIAQMGSLYKLDELKQEIERLTSQAVEKAFNNLNFFN